MTALEQSVEEYLTIRRALGYKLEHHGRYLPKFVAFLNEAGATFVSVDLALEWAKQPDSSQTWWRYRLSMVRGFARYLSAIDPQTQVPPSDLLASRGRTNRKTVPYLYTGDDVAAMMQAARGLSPLQAAAYETLVGLLAATGMRIGEALRLDRDDLDIKNGLLVVHNSKFTKSRELPLHQTTLGALGRYLSRRDKLHPKATGPSLFISTTGARLSYKVVHVIFAKLCAQAGLRARSEYCRPRLHDLRHSFAVSTLLEWYRDGADVPVLMPRLSTYMGHANPASTYWYLQAAPELLALAAARLDKAIGVQP